MKYKVILCLVFALTCVNCEFESIYRLILLADPLPYLIPPVITRSDLSFYLVNGGNPNDLTLLNDNNLSLLDTSTLTKFIIHGWSQDITRLYYKELTENLYTVYGDGIQIIHVSWSKPAGVGYVKAAQNVRGSGIVFGDFLIQTGIDPSLMHILAHSMGAQVTAKASLRIQQRLGKKIARISGLDPAKLLFEGNPINERLDETDATFVDITHTDYVFGYYPRCGHIDFYVNGGGTQTDCPGTTSIFCNHEASSYIYAESILNQTIVATKCSSYTSFRLGYCSSNEKVLYGEFVPQSATGEYHFRA